MERVNQMAKFTTTLMDYLQSELIHYGHNEFINDRHLSFNNPKYAFIKKINNYDEDVQEVVNDKIFIGFSFNGDAELGFKKAFILKFLNREIAMQTMDIFSVNLVSLCIQNQNYIENIFNNLQDFVVGGTNARHTDDSTMQNDLRDLHSTLPQDNINLNVDDTILNYGDDNRITRTKQTASDVKTDHSETYDIGNLLQTNQIIVNLLKTFDNALFSQVYI